VAAQAAGGAAARAVHRRVVRPHTEDRHRVGQPLAGRRLMAVHRMVVRPQAVRRMADRRVDRPRAEVLMVVRRTADLRLTAEAPTVVAHMAAARTARLPMAVRPTAQAQAIRRHRRAPAVQPAPQPADRPAQPAAAAAQPRHQRAVHRPARRRAPSAQRAAHPRAHRRA
jgi:hypothetical protein